MAYSNEAVRESIFKSQRVWIEKKIKDTQESLEYCNINLRIEKGNITIYKKDKTEIVPKFK